MVFIWEEEMWDMVREIIIKQKYLATEKKVFFNLGG